MELEQINKVAIDALEEIKGENIIVIDTHQLTPLFSKMIICSGNSNRQVKALANNVLEHFKKNLITIVGMEGEKEGEWVLVDCGDILIHVMLVAVRQYYDLENLWDK